MHIPHFEVLLYISGPRSKRICLVRQGCMINMRLARTVLTTETRNMMYIWNPRHQEDKIKLSYSKMKHGRQI